MPCVADPPPSDETRSEPLCCGLRVVRAAVLTLYLPQLEAQVHYSSQCEEPGVTLSPHTEIEIPLGYLGYSV